MAIERKPGSQNELQEILKRVRRIEIRSKHMSRQLFSGEYHSAFKGKGMSFAEVRPYQYGDDTRFIDWNVTARYRVPYVKVFEEERELTVILMIDMSRSDVFGTGTLTKQDLVTELAAVLAFSANTNNDKVGAVFFTDKVEHYIPARKGRNHILRIIRELIDFKPENKGTRIATSLDFIARTHKRKAIVFLISDFLDRDYEHALGRASRKHDIIGVQVYDKAEAELPDLGLVLVNDPETGQNQWMNTSAVQVKTDYKSAFVERTGYFENAFQKNNADTIKIRIGEPYLPLLHELFQKRKK